VKERLVELVGATCSADIQIAAKDKKNPKQCDELMGKRKPAAAARRRSFGMR